MPSILLHTPKWLGMSVAVIIFSLVAHVSFAEQCTPETCPDAPIIVEFENNDCSGAREYYTVDQDWNVCQSSDDSSRLARYTDDYAEIVDFRSPHCGLGEEYPTMEAHKVIFGNCFDFSATDSTFASKFKINRLVTKKSSDQGPSGYMYLRNAKQKVTPQTPVVRHGDPIGFLQAVPCPSYQECAAMGVYFTGYFENGCNQAVSGYEVANVSANVCYKSKMGYLSFSCHNKHTVQAAISRNGDCSLPYTVSLLGSVCRQPDHATLYCHAEDSITETLLTHTFGH